MKNYFSISELLEMNLENLPRTVRGLTYKADVKNGFGKHHPINREARASKNSTPRPLKS